MSDVRLCCAQILAEHHQIAFPVTKARAVCDLRWTLLDGIARRNEETARLTLITGPPPAPCHWQILVQPELLPLRAVDEPVDRLMRQPFRRAGCPQAASNLLWRPSSFEAIHHVDREHRFAGEFAQTLTPGVGSS